MIRRRALLATLPAPAAAAEEPGLARIAAGRGILFGTMVTAHWLRDDPVFARLVGREAGFVAPGLELKWDQLRPAPDRFDFAPAEAILEFAAARGLPVRGHTLLWHEALPVWFDPAASGAAMRRTIARHIGTVARRFAGRIMAWDVVNEPLEPWDRQPGGLRASPFLRAMGPGYIADCLAMAAEADPTARLVLNEYDLELDEPPQAARRQAMLELLNTLVRRRAPIHALGLQAHYPLGKAPLDPAVLRRFIRDVASLGLEVQVTELDIIDRLLPADPVARDREVARGFAELLGAVLAEPAVRQVGLWGLGDRDSWINAVPAIRRRDGLPARSHPYDADWAPKPARAAIAAALAAAPPRG